jgi:hypothetical protein
MDGFVEVLPEFRGVTNEQDVRSRFHVSLRPLPGNYTEQRIHLGRYHTERNEGHLTG